MQIGMIGLGRMGGNMVDRLLASDHQCVAFDPNRSAMDAAVRAGARSASSLGALVEALEPPRIVWMMIPAAAVADTLDTLVPLLSRDDVTVDGGNSHYIDSLRHAQRLQGQGIHFVDVGTSGGIHGRELGYCQMIGGDSATVGRLAPLFESLATGRSERAAYVHCGPAGSGHFVKMVHNAIEYGIMQAYAEGFDLLRHGAPGQSGGDEPTGTLDLAAIAEVWRHGSVIRSWLLDLIAGTLADDPALDRFAGPVSDSGEGRWALTAAVDHGVPAPALAAALFNRFDSAGGADFANRLLSAMRHAFGGHGQAKG